MLGHLGLSHLRILEHSGGLADIGLGHAGLSSTFPPPGPGGSQTGHGPFPNQAVLEFSKGAEDMKDELSAGTDRIDVLGQRLEAYPPVFEGRYDFHQVFQGTPQPIQSPHYQYIAFAQHPQAIFQFRAGRALAGKLFLENLFATSLLQGIQLEIGVLILGRNSRVADPHNKHSLSLH